MANKILINCRKVYETGEKYLESSSKISECQEDFNRTKSKISYIWKGGDGYNFAVSFGNHIEELTKYIEFLEFEGELLKKNALDHNTSDVNFSTKMKRSDDDE